MPKVDPTQYIMRAISNLTGGLISDMQSVILGLLVCTFILMGLDWLKVLIESAFTDFSTKRLAGKYSAAAQDSLKRQNRMKKDSYEWTVEGLVYKELVNKEAETRVKGMKI